MNVFMLGNGFDLHYQLPTTYANFLHTLRFLHSHSKEAFPKVGDVFGCEELQKIDDGIAKSYKQYSESYNQTKIDQNNIEIIQAARTNPWVRYFCNNYNVEVKWIDFEKEIANVIDNIEAVFCEADRVAKDRVGIPDKPTDSLIIEILSCFGLGEIKLLADIEKDVPEKRLTYFLTEESGKNSNAFEIKKELHTTLPLRSDQSKLDKEKIVSEMYTALRAFASTLSLYLQVFIEEPLKQIIKTGEKIKQDRLFTQRCKVITFNYTRTFELLYSKSKEEPVICHVHGITEKSDSIVLGVNIDKQNELEGKDTTFLQFKKFFQRVVYRTDGTYMNLVREIQSFSSLENNVQVIVVGHSLDVTDEDIIRELFGLAAKIVVFYYDEKDHSQYVKNLVAIFQKKGFDELRDKKQLEFVDLKEINESVYLGELTASGIEGKNREHIKRFDLKRIRQAFRRP